MNFRGDFALLDNPCVKYRPLSSICVGIFHNFSVVWYEAFVSKLGFSGFFLFHLLLCRTRSRILKNNAKIVQAQKENKELSG